MGNNYWMKLWFDILRDPKMGMLPDRLWRRVIELFLLAGQEGEDGLLPDVPTIAWQLNRSVPAIKADLQRIAEVGIIQEIEEGKWLVTNFKKRNEPVDSKKRMKDFRQRERYEKSDEDVTEVIRECDEASQLRNQEEQKNRGTELKESTTTTAHAREEISEVVKAYESEIGVLTGIIREKLVAALDEYPADWIIKALEESAFNNKRSWAYADAILKRWKVDGFQTDSRTKRDNNRKPTKQLSAGLDEILADAPIFAEDK